MADVDYHSHCVFTANYHRPLCFVVTEYEIAKGVADSGNCRKHCVSLLRTITDLHDHLNHPKAAHFTDLIPGTSLLDVEAQELLDVLRMEKIPKMFEDSDNLCSLDISWSGWGAEGENIKDIRDEEIWENNSEQTQKTMMPDNNVRSQSDGEICDNDNEHLSANSEVEWVSPTCSEAYLEDFCFLLYEQLTRLVTAAMLEIENLVSDTYVVEVIQHLSLCKERCNIFRGRETTMGRLERYMTSDPAQPMVVYGESGCGKTSVLAKAASLLWDLVPDNSTPTLILRFLGMSFLFTECFIQYNSFISLGYVTK